MFKALLLVLACLVTSFAFTQDTTLQRLLAAPDDTVKVNQLLLHIRRYMATDAVEANKQATAVLRLSEKLQYPKGMGTSLLYLGYLQMTANKDDEARATFRRAIPYLEKSGDIRAVAKCLSNIGSTHSHQGRSDSGLHYQQLNIQLLESHHDTLALAQGYINIGHAYFNDLRHYDKAILYFTKAAGIARQAKDTGAWVHALTNIGYTYSHKNDTTRALAYTREALDLAKVFDDYMALGLTHDYYSWALKLKGDLPAAVAASKQALSYFQQVKNNNAFLVASVKLADALQMQKNHSEALSVLLEAKKMMEADKGSIQFTSDFYKQLADVYYALGHYKEAYDSYNQSVIYKDSVITEKNNRLIAEFDAKYQAEKKEKALVQTELKLQKSRQAIYYSLGALVVAILLCGLLYLRYKNKKQAYARQIESIEQEKEIQTLLATMQGEEKERSRIARSLHDGVAGMLAAIKMHFQSVGTQISAVPQTEGYRQGITLLDDVMGEVRKTSHHLMPEVLMAYGLEEALRKYCSSLSNQQTLDVQYHVWGEVGRFKENFELSVYRMVQELLNNTIKHADATQVAVQMSTPNGQLSITVEDNGVGFSQAATKEQGMGLQSLRSRVQAMNGNLEIDTRAGQGTSIHLSFETTAVQTNARPLSPRNHLSLSNEH